MAEEGEWRVRRWRGGRWSAVPDALAVEEPLELRVNGRAVAVTMRTPGHDAELAAGFLLSEGVVRRSEDLAGLRPSPRNSEGNVLDVVLSDTVRVDFAQLSRHVFGASSCGLCGKASIDSVRQRFRPVRERFRIEAAWLAGLPEAMQAAQHGFAATGGLHAAALFPAGGTLGCLREDVGRHNAVDKVLGRALLDDRVPCRHSVLAVSGRASFEIVQKALAAGVAVVVAVGAPTRLAAQFARSSGQTLVGFVRGERLNVYSGHARVEGGR